MYSLFFITEVARFLFLQSRSLAAADDVHVVEIDIYLFRVDRGAGVPGCAEDPAPVGILAEEGGFDQGGVGHGPGDFFGFGGCGPFPPQF